jgi:hypothetical protein
MLGELGISRPWFTEWYYFLRSLPSRSRPS